jgi:hypothetical protein
MSGYKISVASDIHVGPLSTRKDVQTALRLSVENGANAIAIVGDMGDQEVTTGVMDSMAPFLLHSTANPTVPLVWTSGK